jgi:hypothetical protein
MDAGDQRRLVTAWRPPDRADPALRDDVGDQVFRVRHIHQLHVVQQSSRIGLGIHHRAR